MLVSLAWLAESKRLLSRESYTYAAVDAEQAPTEGMSTVDAAPSAPEETVAPIDPIETAERKRQTIEEFLTSIGQRFGEVEIPITWRTQIR